MVANYNHGNTEADPASKKNGQHNGALTGNFSWKNGGPERISTSKTSLHSNASSDKVHLNGFVSSESIAEVEIKTISIRLLGNDKRFGFSVVGGADQGFHSRIEEISEDSPAFRTDLQISDEILEVNGVSVAESTHAEVIMQIHKCIQKKVISLRIRRYLDADSSIDGDFYNHTDGAAITNDGFTREMSVDVSPRGNGGPEYSRRKAAPINERIYPQNASAMPASFVNPGFDKDDISDEDLDSSLAKPSPHRPRTLPIPSFIALVENLKNKLLKPDEQDDVKMIRSLFNSNEFQSAIRAHNTMTRIHARKKIKEGFNPVATNSQFLLSEIRHILLGSSGVDAVADELLDILNKPTLKNFLLAHDRVAMRDSLNSVNDDDDDDSFLDDTRSVVSGFIDNDEETVNIVRIDKTNEPLGATVRNEGDAVIISRIVKGGAAEKSGLLHEGDEILEINDHPVKGKTVNEVVELLRELEGTLTFLLVSGEANRRSPTREKNTFFRAQFDYEPQDDNYLPCRELGLPFRKGDILEILNQEDPNWWQAKKFDEESKGLAKLIPSKTFQQQREATKVTLREEKEPETSRQKRRCFCLRGKKKKTKSIVEAKTPDFAVDEILTYEEMVEIYPSAEKKRPVVLIGPPKVGRRELRQKLISKEPDRFAPAIPHTSKPPRSSEVDGKDYFFVSDEKFQNDIEAHKFVEYGPYEGYHYGTSIEAIRAVTNSGKVCVLNLHCQALPVLKNSDLRPYVVFVTLPSFEQLRRLRGGSGEPFNPNITVKDEELIDLIERAREMDINYGHYFDHQIVNQDLDKAYEELLRIVNFLETQPQWIPAAWVD